MYFRGKTAHLFLYGALREKIPVKTLVALYYDRERNAVGIQPSSEGYKVGMIGGQVGINATAFCKQFGLDKRYVVTAHTMEDDIYVLPLTEINV